MPRLFPSLPREYALSFGGCIIMLGVSLGSYLFLPPQIPLWYSLAQINDQLAPKEAVFLPSLFALLATSIHFFIFGRLSWLDHALKRLMSVSTILVVFLCAVVLLRTLLAAL